MRKNSKSAGRTTPWTGTILGQPYSKANSRRLVINNGKVRFIKSGKAISYAKSFALQCPALDPMFVDDVCVELTIYYASNRPDLDESIVLDAMQDRIYTNDRLVREKVVRHGIDKLNPRTEIRVSLLKKRGDAETG